jgi:hypothetical protein
MAHEDPRDLNKLWQDQTTENVRMAIEEIRARGQRMKKKGDRRNLLEYAAAAFVVAASVAYGSREKNVTVLAGIVLMALGALFVACYLYRFGTVQQMPADLGLQDCLNFQRAELVRQRDLLGGVWWWYLLPLVPGPALILIGRAIERADRRWPALLGAIVCGVTFFAIGKLNEQGARKLQQLIDGLDQTNM